MSDEVKAALEYWRSGSSHAQYPDHWEDCRHAWTLADAYLAAHPADDGEPADLEFITSELRKVSSDWTTVASTIGIEATSLKSKARITAFNPNGFTRTSVRSLLSALGVPQQ